jgi:PadR family transcriptional regulator
MRHHSDLLQGTLDLLVLKTLMLGPLHGWGISKRLRQLSNDAFEIGQGSLYPALYRLEDRGYLEASWAISEEGKRAKFYQLTPAGRRHFVKSNEEWSFFQMSVQAVLSAT